MARLKVAAKVAGGAVAAAALVAVATLSAGADPTKGTYDGTAEAGYPANMSGGMNHTPTALFKLNLDGGGTLKTYCIELRTDIDHKHPGMVEQAWDSYPVADSPFNDNRAKVNWVLHHSYPATGVDDIEDEVGDFVDGLTVQEAITATQAAIWHFSDDADLNLDNPTQVTSAKADVAKLYSYLIGDANTGIEDQPTPALKITPDSASGLAGELIGPFTVETTGEIKDVSGLPEGAELVDAEGNAIEDIMDGTELFVKLPADTEAGEGQFTLTATASVDTGRLFIGEDYEKYPTQSFIVAQSENTRLTDSVTFTWRSQPPTTTTRPTTTTPSETTTPPTETTSASTQPPVPTTTTAPPAEELPSTGASIMIPLLVGIGLVGAGVGALLLQRRRGSRV